MGIIRSFVTLGVAMVALKAIEETKKKIDTIDEIEHRMRQTKDEMERMREILEKWDRVKRGT